MTEGVITADELSTRLRVGRNTAYGLLASGAIRHVRTGQGRNARILIPESAVEEFLAGRGSASPVAGDPDSAIIGGDVA